MNKIFKQWLDSSFVKKSDKNLMSKLSQEEIDQNFIDTNISFGTAGARGAMKPGTQFINEQTIAQITIGYINFIKSKKIDKPLVIIGHDNRRKSKEYSFLVAKILSGHGIKSKLFGITNKLMPTPIVSFAIREQKADGGIIITASHNPKEYNGFKVYKSDGGQLLQNETDIISKLMPNIKTILLNKTPMSVKNIRYMSTMIIVNKYFEAARGAIINQKKFTKNPIIFTGHHGTSVKLLPKFLKKIGFYIVPLKEQCFYNPDFVNSPNSNPEDVQSFDSAIKLANKLGSKTIIGIDPDGDRMCVMIKNKNEWKQISGNEMGIIFTYYILSQKRNLHNPYIISSFVSNTLIDKIAEKYNATVYRTGTGFKWMGDLITKIGKKQDFVVAFEEAIGALVLPINRDKDAFTASALCLEIIDFYQAKNLNLIDVLQNKIFQEYGHWYGKTESFTVPGFDWKEQAEEKMQILSEYKKLTIGDYQIKSISWNKQGSCLDWILNNDSWIRFRKSGTEPKFKIYYNFLGKSQEKLFSDYQEINNFFRTMLNI